MVASHLWAASRGDRIAATNSKPSFAARSACAVLGCGHAGVLVKQQEMVTDPAWDTFYYHCVHSATVSADQCSYQRYLPIGLSCANEVAALQKTKGNFCSSLCFQQITDFSEQCKHAKAAPGSEAVSAGIARFARQIDDCRVQDISAHSQQYGGYRVNTCDFPLLQRVCETGRPFVPQAGLLFCWLYSTYVRELTLAPSWTPSQTPSSRMSLHGLLPNRSSCATTRSA